MPVSHPRLPAPDELAAWIRDQRYVHDLSQTELADRVGISPSQLSRIETQSGRATYQTLYDIQDVLETLGDAESSPVAQILEAKAAARSEEYTLAYATPTQPIADVGQRMNDLDISQLPVFTEAGDNVGRITDQDLVSLSVEAHDTVEEHMRRPFPEVPADAPQSTARNQLRTNEAVLMTPGDTGQQPVDQTGVVGILTPADFTGELRE